MLPLCLGMGIALLDQATKFLVRKHFVLHEALPVLPGFFNLRYVQNTGAAWGLFAGGHYWLALLSLLVFGALVVFRRSFFTHRWIDQVSFGLFIGGIAGNFIDRVRLNYVVDFLDFHWRVYHFPAFNVADSAICCGVGLTMVSQFMLAREERMSAASPGAAG